jgi:RNA polymerase sigma factor (sigma-70 family)
MSARSSHPLLRFIHQIAVTEGTSHLSDRELLDRFASSQDETAIAALMKRHGPMVLGVCRRLLPNSVDAEDVFQATWMVLLRKAAMLPCRSSVAGFLYEVARTLAINVKIAAVRRRRRELKARTPRPADPLAELASRELLGVLEEELALLPDKYRSALLLCYLEGKSRGEASRQLRCPLATLKSRLQRGRDLLRTALARRGLTLTDALLAAALMENTLQAALPSPLVDGTIRAVALPATSQAAAGVISERVAALIQGVTKTMLVNKLKLGLTVSLAVGLLVVGAGLATQQVMLGEKDQQPLLQREAQSKRIQLKPAPGGRAADSEKASISLEQLKKKLKEQRDKIKSLRLVYNFESEAPVGWDLVKEWKVPWGPEKAREEIAVKGNKRYHRGGAQGEEADHDIRAFDGEKPWMLQKGICFIYKPQSKMRVFRSHYLLQVGLMYPDPTGDEEHQTFLRAYMLPEIFETPGYQLKGMDKVAGALCLIIEGKMPKPPWFTDKKEEETATDDRLWLDTEHGMVLRKRELSVKGRLVTRFQNSDLKEILPGYWLPLECQEELLSPENAPKEYHGKPAVVIRCKVRKWNVNDVKEDFFAVPDGVQVMDLRNEDG